MEPNIQELKDGIATANQKVTKVAADVKRLHDKIDTIGTAPTAEEWAEIKSDLTTLNTSLQAVDDSTPEEEVTTPGEGTE